MGDMLIRGMPEPLKSEIAKAAEQRNESLSTKAIDLLRKGLIAEKAARPAPGQSAWDMIRSIYTADGPATGEFSAMMDEIEAKRKLDFGRPVDLGKDDDRS